MKKLLFIISLVVFSLTMFAQQKEQKITCTKCKGSGKVRITEERRCSDCNGNKTKIVYYIEQCPQCKGKTTMQVPDRNGNWKTVPCNFPGCKDGKIRTPKTETCGTCGGTGIDKWTTEVTCPKCNGSGKIKK